MAKKIVIFKSRYIHFKKIIIKVAIKTKKFKLKLKWFLISANIKVDSKK